MKANNFVKAAAAFGLVLVLWPPLTVQRPALCLDEYSKPAAEKFISNNKPRVILVLFKSNYDFILTVPKKPSLEKMREIFKAFTYWFLSSKYTSHVSRIELATAEEKPFSYLLSWYWWPNVSTM